MAYSHLLVYIYFVFLSIISNFVRLFSTFNTSGPARIVLFIDDLDRCPPDRVVEVLEAVQLLVKTPLFIAVVAIDERYVTRALEKYYAGVLFHQGRPSGTDYLEKIIRNRSGGVRNLVI
jgi:predicted KAP-like P-loop ATPase